MLALTIPMQTSQLLLAAITFLLLTVQPLRADARVTEAFDDGWRFLKADAPGADRLEYDDRTWRKLDLPHDWSIEGPFAATNATGGTGGFLPAGIGWYRKQFLLPATFSRGRVRVEFDGVMANSEVWINGFHLGQRPSGYASFGYDLTGHLNFGNQANVMAVRADTSAQPASRWYAGAGIYRHVRLVMTEEVHVAPWGVFVSTPQVSSTQAWVRVQTAITNASDAIREITLQTALLDPDGQTVATLESGTVITNGRTEIVTQQILFPNPQRWNLNDPKLYRIATRIREGSTTLDDVVTPFGIREATFRADTGFWLNGKNLKIKGVCLHHDGGAFGAAVPLDVWEQRLAALQKIGVNALRTAHNPPSPEFLDLCDRMGFLVMDELFDCWTMGKHGLDGMDLQDYHLHFNAWSKIDERDTLLRDRNHPSVILYSMGNDIHDTTRAELAKGILKGLVEVAHATDPTRPVTQGLFRPDVSHDYDNGLADLLDVVGQNDREQEILAAHTQKPSRKILGTENTHDRKQWVAVRDHAPHAGQFLWTGVDYLGEATTWPSVGHGSGLLDRTGEPRPLAFERESWWCDAPMVRMARRIALPERMPTDPGDGTEEKHTPALFADWTPKNPLPHDETVEVYSNARDVELLLNGKSLGSKPLNADATPRVWIIPFTAGHLKAVARNERKSVATDELRTAGAPAKIVLASSRKKLGTNWDAIARVTATIVDKKGVRVPGAEDLITFNISGPGEIAAVDNGENASHEPFQSQERRAIQGRCVAFIRAVPGSGTIELTASALGLMNGSLSIRTPPSSPRE